tara:strand:- start:32 stop:283 length:252 start_codon:yes stop_codon:yes gene_type:complete
LGGFIATPPPKKSGSCKYLNTTYTQLNKEITMAGKSYMKKKRETIEEKALKLQKKFLTLADTKGAISDKEMELFTKLITKKKK